MIIRPRAGKGRGSSAIFRSELGDGPVCGVGHAGENVSEILERIEAELTPENWLKARRAPLQAAT